MKKVVTFGEIMMRLSPPGFQRLAQASKLDVIYGGGESNVAVSLANYGASVDFVTRLPENDLGRCAMRELRKYGVGVDQIVWGGERLGIYFLENGAVSRGSKVTYDRAYSSMSEVEPGMVDWKKVFDGVGWFHWSGITPAISKKAADTCLEAVKTAAEMNITISMDPNYRAQLWRYCDSSTRQDIMSELTSYADIITCGEGDAAMYYGINPDYPSAGNEIEQYSDHTFQRISQQMMEKFPKAKKVVTTRRGSISASHNTWSGLLYDGDKLVSTRTYQITDIVDRVGGGDAFMGALIYGFMKYKEDDQKALDFAIAASCLKHTIKGDINLVTVEEVKKLMNGDASGRVAR